MRGDLVFVGLCLVAGLARADAVGTLDKVRRTGEIAVGFRETSMPFSYLDGQGAPVGFGVDLCRRIVDDVRLAVGRDVAIRWQPNTSTNRIPLVQNGTVDVECASTTNNRERQQQVAFSINYFYAGTRLLVRTGSPVRSFADLRGRPVVSTTGTSNHRLMRRLDKEQSLGIDLLSAKDPAESALMVATGRADAYAMDDVILYFLRASSLRPADWEVVGDTVQVEPYAAMFRKDDPAFKALVDGTLARLMRSGEFEQLYRKWFEQPIPPKGLNLNHPMGAELKANLTVLSDRPSD
ncbi:MAG: amino acid ABC transporter substrate-binding protein [Rhizobacter sp.]